ncbi:MAG: MFS transporter [Bacteroidales bacterium]
MKTGETVKCPIQKVSLWTPDFIFAFIANLLLFFAFYLLVPVLPFYVINDLGTSESLAGVILSLYTLAALLIRPFSGYMVDAFTRKPLYLICYAIFTTLFAGYLLAGTLTLFIVLRIAHGFAFGITSVSGNTLAIDVMPSERRGEGIGYFGMASNIAMALGPMTGLFLYHSYSFSAIFLSSFLISCVGFTFVLWIKAPPKIIAPVKDVISLDRFFLLKGLPQFFVLAFAGLGYGVIVNYMGMYGKSIGIGGSAGFFFTLLAMGIVVARLLSAKLINQGKIAHLIYTGLGFLLLAYALFVLNTNPILFYISALLLGLGFGYISPASQTIFINLAPHNRRGTANSSYLTAWDLGIGLGVLIGGGLIEQYGFTTLFIFCFGAVLTSLGVFKFCAAPYFEKNKLR